jgi:hypothetical protein
MDLKKNLGGRGNTSTDKKQHISMRLYPYQVDILNELAREFGRNRTEIIECFIGLFTESNSELDPK